MTSGYKVYSIINGLPQRQAWGEVCHVVSCWVFFCDDMMSFNIKLLFTVRISAFRFYCIKAVLYVAASLIHALSQTSTTYGLHELHFGSQELSQLQIMLQKQSSV